MPRSNSETSALQTAIVDFLNLHGHAAHRNHTTGVFDPKRKTFRRVASASKGVGDILCCFKGGLWLEIEVKTGRDKLSEAQVLRSFKVDRAGGLYWVVRNFDEFLTRYNLLMESLKS
jgi:hypothetical protein